ncbi:hypothetical protein Trydic_g12642 [Trypoxylus dichotomus]
MYAPPATPLTASLLLRISAAVVVIVLLLHAVRFAQLIYRSLLPYVAMRASADDIHPAVTTRYHRGGGISTPANENASPEVSSKDRRFIERVSETSSRTPMLNNQNCWEGMRFDVDIARRRFLDTVSTNTGTATKKYCNDRLSILQIL